MPLLPADGEWIQLPVGNALLHNVGLRIVSGYLVSAGYRDVHGYADVRDEAAAIDLSYRDGVSAVTVTLKVDPYFGTDPMAASDRSLPFYRTASDTYALEVVANSLTRQPGWLTRSNADLLFYYRIAIGQQEDEISALMAEPDEVFFTELEVERDDLCSIPFPALREWFDTRQEAYISRPIALEGRSAWHRIVPASDLEASVQGVTSLGSAFAAVAASHRSAV